MKNRYTSVVGLLCSISESFAASYMVRGFTPRVRLAAVLVAALLSVAPWCSAMTALDNYVAKPDATYNYSLDSTIAGAGFTGYHIDLTSQTWRDPSEITQSWKAPGDPTQNQWEHKMMIAEPDNLTSSTAILIIDGGTHPDGFDAGILNEIAGASIATNSVVVNLPTIPNQRLRFDGEGFNRTEDEIIAKTFRKFLDNDAMDPNIEEWPLLLPMVKSAVRAMDATQAHMLDQGVEIKDFFIMGASKRGWTTWLTAAAEARPGGPNRVAGIAPAVIDFLNIDESMVHHKQVYSDVTEFLTGGYSDQVEDYVLEGVMDQLGTARGQELLEIVDPYEYRDRLDLPKYILNGTGDEFFVSDSSQIYIDDLIGPSHLRYFPNAGHGLDSSAIPGALGFKMALDQGLTLPEYSWEISENGETITVNTSEVDTLLNVTMWSATNPVNRDYRTYTFGLNWNPQSLSEQGINEYIASVPIPATGSTAFMIELEYLVGGVPLKFTTDVSVVQHVPETTTCVLLATGLCLSLLGSRRGRRLTAV